MHNSFGKAFRIEIYGGSHTESLGVILTGVPAGIELCEADFEADLNRRRAGAKGTTPRREGDIPHIVSGVRDGITTGDKLEILFYNENTRSGDYDKLRVHPRPSHADLVQRRKYGEGYDISGGGMASGRMTVALVAAGVVAKRLLGKDIDFTSEIVELGGSRDRNDFEQILLDAVADGDSVGGVIECRVKGLPVGLGEPFFDSTESIISHLLFSIPAVKGVELILHEHYLINLKFLFLTSLLRGLIHKREVIFGRLLKDFVNVMALLFF